MHSSMPSHMLLQCDADVYSVTDACRRIVRCGGMVVKRVRKSCLNRRTSRDQARLSSSPTLLLDTLPGICMTTCMPGNLVLVGPGLPSCFMRAYVV